MNYSLVLNAGEVNLILKGLGELPHKEVAGLSYKIFGMVKSQEEAAVNPPIPKKEEAPLKVVENEDPPEKSEKLP